MRALLPLLLLAGCAAPRLALVSYVDAFTQEAGARGVAIHAEDVQLVFVEDLGQAAGRCTPDAGRIEISRRFWADETWSEATRRQAVFHELAHCLLHLPHDVNERGLWGRPGSMMYPELLGGPWYEANEATYLDRLFAEGQHQVTLDAAAVLLRGGT